ncbi:hypothetical protein [Microcoleus sp. LEGE 07076]|uniref:hypothetical protein n=1 Tax=Microcoleus sp. LEGE 07076 TaxID=915322 RepID=UPI001882ECA0|nr:hypothetical protein [Microcoleus sp. LEGE 07076]
MIVDRYLVTFCLGLLVARLEINSQYWRRTMVYIAKFPVSANSFPVNISDAAIQPAQKDDFWASSS